MKFIYHGNIIYKVEIISIKSHSFKTHFFRLWWDAVCRSRKTFSWSIGAHHTRCVSACRHPQNGVFAVRPSGGQNGGSWRVQNGDCRADEGEHSTPRSGVIMQDQALIHLPVCSNP